MNRSGSVAAHSSSIQSFQARTTAKANWGSSELEALPAKPERADGKFNEAYTPLMSISATRATDPGAAPHGIKAGRFESTFFDGLPTTALSPVCDSRMCSKSHT